MSPDGTRWLGARIHRFEWYSMDAFHKIVSSAFALSGGMPCNTIRDVKIHEFLWPEDRVAHIAQHGVRPEEVEDVCFGRALVQRTTSAGANPVYYVLGQTAAGRYLFCVVIQFPDGRGFPVTARSMTRQEQ